MKKNKKRLLIGTLILFVVWSCVTVFIIFKDNKNIVINKELGILSVSTIDNINIKIGNDFYIKDEGKKLVVYDFNNNVVNETVSPTQLSTSKVSTKRYETNDAAGVVFWVCVIVGIIVLIFVLLSTKISYALERRREQRDIYSS